MNRRVLLIDADPAFRDTLTRELARYRVAVVTEPDADRALALGTSEAPAMVIVCIEEADKKSGFRVFEKCKKGALSKVPIVLVTGSVPAESFAKHRNLKVHADEYLDKRTMSTHELVGKIDGLIALGDPEEADLSTPVEDEVPMEIADGDVVLDDVLGNLAEPEPHMLAHAPVPAPVGHAETHDEFEQNEALTVGPQDGLTVDVVVGAETDAAFDALMGGFGDEPEPTSNEPALAEAGEHHAEAIAALASAEEAVSVPELIHDGRGRGTTPPPLVSSVPAFIIDHPAPAEDDQGPSLAPEPVVAESPPQAIDPVTLDALPVDALPVDALPEHEAAYAEDVIDDSPFAQATEMYEAAEDGGVPLEGLSDHHDSGIAIALDDEELVPMLEGDEAIAVEVEIEPLDETPDERRGRSSGRTIVPQLEPHEATAIAQMPTSVPMPPLVPEHPPVSSRPLLSRTATNEGSHPAIDLGLDAVADNVRSEQSGVFDRRALRTIGEFERQIAQLKTELERARSAVEPAPKGGRESQFLHLRESMLAKEKELKQAKTDLDARDVALADATARMQTAEGARTALEAKQSELDKRATEETAKAQKLTAAARQSEGQLAQLQQEVERLAKTGASAEVARAQLEKELATERATGKASASEAERLLRTEREQLVQRHAQELATTRAEIEAAKHGSDTRAREEREALAKNHEAVLATAQRQREQLAREHASALQQHQVALANAQYEREQLMEAHHAAEQLRAASGGDHLAALAALAHEHEDVTVALEAKHAGERSKLVAELETTRQAHDDAITRMMGEHAAALEQRGQAHAVELAETLRLHANNLTEAERSRTALLAEATQGAAAAAGEREQALAAQARTHEQALAAQARTHEQQLAALQATHEAGVAADHHAAAEATAEAIARAVAAHEATAAELATTRAELERALAAHEVKLGAARRDHETEIGRHEEARRELEQAHRGAMEQLVAAHRDQLAEAAVERDQLATSHQRTVDAQRAALAAATETHRTALADREAQHQSALNDATARHAAELEAITASARDEVAEHKSATAAARRAAEEAATAHAVASDAATKAHAHALAESESKRARELGDATSEFAKLRSATDAEHARAMALARADADKARTHLVSEHDKAAKELISEREELKRGLSGARDSLKRSEGELASAVQSIADRNAELRQHAAAIAERDTRIAELRTEIEGLETENASYQDQVLRAYQKLKTDEAMVARARKAMAIALTVLDDQSSPAPGEKPKS